MTLRIEESFSSSNWSPGATGTAAGTGAGTAAFGVGAAAEACVPPAAITASISDLTMRPRGPLPKIRAKSSPAWVAIRLARGDARMRDPPSAGGAGVASGVTGACGAGARLVSAGAVTSTAGASPTEAELTAS